MKKLFYLLFLLPLAFFGSCSDDNDMAQVDFNVTLSGVTRVDNNFYTVVGNTVVIDGVSVKSLTDKGAVVTGVRYFLDGIPVFASIDQEDNTFVFDIDTEGFKEGTHALGITATVLQVDKTITSAALRIPLIMVADEESLQIGRAHV